MEMGSSEPAEFVEGTSIRPADRLLQWLQSEAESESGEQRQFRLPVVVRFDDSYQLGIDSVFIGTSPDALDDTCLFLEVSDHAMGISLTTKLRDLCSKGEEVIAVWLEGYWGEEQDLLLFSEEPDDDAEVAGPEAWPFSALAVGERIAPGADGEVVMAYIEAP